MSEVVLIEWDDVKTRSWRPALAARGIDLIAVSSLGQMIRGLGRRGRRPAAVIFRYLNDSPRLRPTLERSLGELAVLLAARRAGVRACWLCHNVDRETTECHPWLTRLRRRVMTRLCHRVIVTDPLLAAEAGRRLGVAAGRVAVTTFGAPPAGAGGRTPDWFLARVREFAGPRGDGGPGRPLVGLAVGHASWKTAHLERAEALLAAGAGAGLSLRLVVVGPIRQYLAVHAPGAWRFLERDPRVLLHEGYLPVDEADLEDAVDFLWRAYRDWSTPYGLYAAARAGKPLLTLDVGFLARAVRHYALGGVVREDLADLPDVLEALTSWDRRAGQRFLAGHSWEIGAAGLAEAVRG